MVSMSHGSCGADGKKRWVAEHTVQDAVALAITPRCSISLRKSLELALSTVGIMVPAH